MAGKQSGGYEAELNRIRALSDSIIPKTSALIHALESLDGALANARKSEYWTGSSAEAATAAAVDEIRDKFTRIRNIVTVIDSAVGEGNEARRTAASAELPSAAVDPFWANAAKGASFVVHPVLGPLAADKALDVIGDFLGNQREEAARAIVEKVEKALLEPTRKLSAASAELNQVRIDSSNSEKIDDGPTGGPEIDAPRIGSPGIGGVPSGSAPGVGGTPAPSGGVGTYQPPVPTSPAHPGFPTPPTNPGTRDRVGPGGTGWRRSRASRRKGPVDRLSRRRRASRWPWRRGQRRNGWRIPDRPRGYVPGGGAGGGGLGGIVGGGAGAAAIAASSKIAGFGSMGGLGGAGLGPGAGAGLKAGGGLLGNSAVGGLGGVGGAGGPGGMAGAGGVGGAGAAGTGSSGAAGAGGRPGMGMMGGAGGADEEEKAKRSGLGGPIAPKLEDEEEAGPAPRVLAPDPATSLPTE